MIHLATVHEADDARSVRRGTVLDVRNADEFAAGHVPGSVLMPLPLVPLRSSELERGETYYVVCESGARSAQACAYLAAQGFAVRSVQGGMSSWRVAGLPVESGQHVPAAW